MVQKEVKSQIPSLAYKLLGVEIDLGAEIKADSELRRSA
jgi:hypothetical protein